MFEQEPLTALINAIGFSAFSAITIIGIIFIMYINYKLFDNQTEKELEIKILKEKLQTAKHRNDRFKKEQLVK